MSGALTMLLGMGGVPGGYSAGGGGSYADAYSSINPTVCTLAISSGGAGAISGANSGSLYSWAGGPDYPYKCSVHVTSGSLGGSAVDTDILCSDAPSWNVSNGSTSAVSATFTLYIKDAAGNVLDSATYTITADAV